jgi:hypothetical protein
VTETRVATLSSSASQTGSVRAVGSTSQNHTVILRSERVCVVCVYV